jgi:hypothetical protein
VHCKHVLCSILTHSTNEDLLSIKGKGDPKSRTLSRTSDTTETRNPCVIKVILLACFTDIDIFKFIKSLLTYWQTFFFLLGSKLLRFRKERQFDWMRLDSALRKVVPDISRPKKSRHVFMHWMSVNLPDNFQIREHSLPCLFHIICKYKDLWQHLFPYNKSNNSFELNITIFCHRLRGTDYQSV